MASASKVDHDEQLNQTEMNRLTIENICKRLRVKDNDLKKLKILMLNKIEMGLCQTTTDNTSMKCHPTYIRELPTGCEQGEFLGLNLNGKNLHISYIQSNPYEEHETEFEMFEIPENVATGLGRNLFNYIAECLSGFLIKRHINGSIDLGFTLSHPFNQTSISKGTLIKWNEGLNCEDIIGVDMVFMLKDAIRRQNMDIDINVIAILNQATSTLISCAYKNKNTKIGIIVGNETSASYLEKVKYIPMIKQDLTGPVTMVINTEWNNFGDADNLDFIRTTFDKQLDENSEDPGIHLFDKMVSGFYLGELTRLILIACIKDGALFGGNVTDPISRPNSFKTKYLLQIESEHRGAYTIMRQILEILGYKKVSDDDCENIRYICERVTKRSSNLMATAIACLIDRIGDPYVVVAIDGYIYKMHPCYGTHLKKTARLLALPEHKFDIMTSDSHYEKGAALLAATLAHKNKPQEKSSIS